MRPARLDERPARSARLLSRFDDERRGAATQVATQDTTFSGSDPTMAAKFLHAYPAGELVDGTPGTFLGRPIHVSSNASAMGSAYTVLTYGDMSYFVAREVGGLQLENSQDVFFAKNQIALRGYTRTDSALTDATAVVTLRQSVT